MYSDMRIKNSEIKNSQVVIRAMTREDIEAVLEIERASVSDPWSHDAFHATLLLPYAHYYVAEIVPQVVAETTALQKAADSAVSAEKKIDKESEGTTETDKTADAADHPHIIAECGVRDIMGEGEITNVAVHPDFRGKGIARQMMKHVLHESLAKGITSFTLEVRAGNRAAIALYERFGFRTEGVRREFYEDPVENALIMWLRQESSV